MYKSNQALSLVDIKKELTRLGLSISTPGINGEDRYEELKIRLDNALYGSSSIRKDLGTNRLACVILKWALTVFSFGFR
jgi:hypothetical protein